MLESNPVVSVTVMPTKMTETATNLNEAVAAVASEAFGRW